MRSTNIQLPGGSGPASELFSFKLEPGAGACAHALEALGSAARERWMVRGAVRRGAHGRFDEALGDAYAMLSCAVAIEPETDLRALTRTLYGELLERIVALGYPQLVRVWNHIPEINRGRGDDEVYRQFCWGRAEAFDRFDGPLPAATGTGSGDGVLRICLLAATGAVELTHLENPRQISAFHYPREYGPRSPSFARATKVQADGAAVLLISGTASIVNHEALHAGDLTEQICETARNVRCLQAHAPELQPLAVRYYLRHAADQALLLARFGENFPSHPAPVVIPSELCRDDLLAEIELVLG